MSIEQMAMAALVGRAERAERALAKAQDQLNGTVAVLATVTAERDDARKALLWYADQFGDFHEEIASVVRIARAEFVKDAVRAARSESS